MFIGRVFLSDVFTVNTDKEAVYKTLFRLTELNPNMVLTFREGRRRNDSFKKTTQQVDALLYSHISCSNEWRVFFPPKNKEKNTDLTQASLNFYFVNDHLYRLANDDGLNIILPFSLIFSHGIKTVGRKLRKLFTRLSFRSELGVEVEDEDLANKKISNQNKVSQNQNRYEDRQR